MSRNGTVVVALTFALAISTAPLTAQPIKGKAGELFVQAQSLMASGQLEKAQTVLREALKVAEGPSDPIVIAGRIAAIQASLGKFEEAKAYLTVQADKTGNSGYKIELARLILQSDPSGAPAAVQILKDIVSREPKNTEAWIEYGRALARASDYPESMRAYEQVTMHLAPRELRAHYGLVETFILSAMFKRATNAMTAALAINPEAPESYVWLGRTYDRDLSKVGRFAFAVEQYERAFQLDKTQAMYLGHVLFDLIMSDNYDNAKSYGKRLDKYPSDSVKFWFDGLLKELSGDVAGALTLFQRAVAANPQNIYAHFALAHVYSGEPSPGFGPLRGARTERWRYAPHRDLKKASQEAHVVRLLDPTFPYQSTLLANVTEKLAAEYPTRTTPDEASAQRIKKMVGYFKHLQMTR